jgi:hypothetical protein
LGVGFSFQTSLEKFTGFDLQGFFPGTEGEITDACFCAPANFDIWIGHQRFQREIAGFLKLCD